MVVDDWEANFLTGLQVLRVDVVAETNKIIDSSRIYKILEVINLISTIAIRYLSFWTKKTVKTPFLSYLRNMGDNTLFR